MCGVIIYQASMMEQKQEKLGNILVRYRVADFDMRVNYSCMCFAAGIKGAATCEYVMHVKIGYVLFYSLESFVYGSSLIIGIDC